MRRKSLNSLTHLLGFHNIITEEEFREQINKQ